MKAINIDGQIRIFQQVPNEWKHFLNFSQADEALLKEEGFFDLVIPEYLPDTQRLGQVFFDEKLHVFTYEVVEIQLEQLKQSRTLELESYKKRTNKELLDKLLAALIVLHKKDLPLQLISEYEKFNSEIGTIEQTLLSGTLEDIAKLKIPK